MRILTDFDGVLTEQTEEAHRVRELFAQELARVSRAPQAVDALLKEVDSELAARPSRHGWRSRGRITAFADEDLFIRVNGMAACLDAWSEEGRTVPSELRGLLQRNEATSFTALAQASYAEMVRETQSGKLKPMDPAAAGVLDRLLSRGHEIVVVSNSGTQRILDLLQGAGIPASSHETGASARIRVRGNARKFELGEERRGFQVEDFFVDTHRPAYESILREERPDVVVGDVFSLDLALPYGLMGEGQLFLRERPYTPSWVKTFCRDFGQAGRPTVRAIDRLESLESL